MPGYRKRVLALFARDPSVLMVAMRDGHGHVIGVALHPDFILGVDEMPLRMAIATMPRHERKCWLATEVGYLDDGKVVGGVVLATDRFVAPMSVEECSDYYGYAESTVNTYLTRARRHLRDRLEPAQHPGTSRPLMTPEDGAERLLRRLLK